MKQLSEIEIAWLAGLFEGEATFGIDKRSKIRYPKSTSPPSPYIRISMIDKDIIERVATLLEGKPFVPKRKTSAGNEVYTLHIGDRKTLCELLPLILPYLGQRRQKRVQECLQLLQEWKDWEQQGGRSQMAAEGGRAKAKKLVESKSKLDMISPEDPDAEGSS